MLRFRQWDQGQRSDPTGNCSSPPSQQKLLKLSLEAHQVTIAPIRPALVSLGQVMFSKHSCRGFVLFVWYVELETRSSLQGSFLMYDTQVNILLHSLRIQQVTREDWLSYFDKILYCIFVILESKQTFKYPQFGNIVVQVILMFLIDSFAFSWSDLFFFFRERHLFHLRFVAFNC